MPGLKDLPHGLFGSGFGIKAGDLDPAFVLPAASLPSGASIAAVIPQGGLAPNQIGLIVWNATGSPITAGQLVYISGWNAANAMPQVSLAIATAGVSAAQYVALATIANGASGVVGLHFRMTGQNTNTAAAVGDPVFLDVNAGGFFVGSSVAATPPQYPPAAIIYQVVGRVVAKSATVGIIDFDLLSLGPPLLLDWPETTLPTIPTTAGAVVNARILVRKPGTLGGIALVFKDALATGNSSGAGTGSVAFTLTNLGNAGVGTTVMLAVSPAGVNSTATTGGAAIAADTPYGLAISTANAGANLVVAAGDVLKLTATNTGGGNTLANAVTEGIVCPAIIPK